MPVLLIALVALPLIVASQSEPEESYYDRLYRLVLRR